MEVRRAVHPREGLLICALGCLFQTQLVQVQPVDLMSSLEPVVCLKLAVVA